MYKNFHKYILRTPLFPVNYFLQLTKNEIISDEELIREFSNPIIAEAIYLASPILYKQIEKWTKNGIKEEKEKVNIKNSFLKYLSRLSSRPTPFGLFAGSAVGAITDNDLIVKESHDNKRYTRLDMNLTGLLVRQIENAPNVKNQLLYYPNTSLYVSGNQLRYVESHYRSNGILIHQVVEVDNTEYLDKIISSVKEGLLVKDIAATITSPEITLEEAQDFIHELIDNQILISEIEQTVSGKENIDNLLIVLERIDHVDNFKNAVRSIKQKLLELDLQTGNTIDFYDEISAILKSLDLKFNEKYVFQTDLILKTRDNSINSDINAQLEEAIELLNKISEPIENSNLNDFKMTFFERYETREMALSSVMDEESGLGYPVKSAKKDVNPLIDDLFFKGQTVATNRKVEWSPLQSLLLKKLIVSNRNKSRIIELNPDEFTDFPVRWNNLPDTFSAITQMVDVDGRKKIVMNAVGGSSAGNLLGRFCHGDTEINQFVNEIIAFEKKVNSDKIVAEIIHLPEDRLGNILMRPSFRKYEIPYLSKSSKQNAHQILLDDITIAIRNNKIVLKSIKENREIITKLTTAHSFTSSSLPVYRFLCDMQFNNKRSFLRFDWGALGEEFSFFPRVIYKDIILSTAKWKIDTEQIKKLAAISDKDKLLQKAKEWCEFENLPQCVYLVEGDNKLLINLLNISSLAMLFSEIKSKKTILFEEFLFKDNFICSDEKNQGYVNEFVFSFYNDMINSIQNINERKY